MSTHIIFSATEKNGILQRKKKENREDYRLETAGSLSDGTLIVCTEKKQNIIKKEENREDRGLETAGKL